MFDHILSKVLECKWAITPAALEQILRVCLQDFKPSDLAAAMHGDDVSHFLTAEGQFDFSAIAARDDDRLANTRRATVRDNVAVVPVTGPIFPRANLFTAFSGGSSISSIARDFTAAVEAPGVTDVILNMDSPGGEVTGVSELAQMIYQARDKVRVTAYVYGWGASAGYWIGSAAEEIVVADTAEVGSIGVVASYLDDRERLAKNGIKEIEIVSSQSPNKRPDPASQSGRSQIQTIVDQLADVFVAAVAKHRGTSVEDVLDNFGQGGMIVAADAIARGMADRIGSLEGIIAEKIENNRSTIQGGFSMNDKKPGSNESGQETPVVLTVETLKAEHADVYNAVLAAGIEQGRTEGAQSERERIQAIETIEAPGFENVVAENKFKPEATKDSVAALVLDAQSAARKAQAEAIGQDGGEVAEAAGKIQSGHDNDEKAEEKKESDAAAERMAKHANAGR